MKLEFISKSLDYLNNDPYRTKVILGNTEGVFYPIYFDKEAINKSDVELLELALETIYQENFPNRAENEKFNEIGEKIAKYDDLIEKSHKAIAELEKATEEAKRATARNEESVNSAVAELTELVNGVLTTLLPNEEG
ncbi:DUF1366 domain-containing protein [Streptococcus suis]|nr:DUF1366 domain-containing protein [Streptococcus suis]